MTDYLIDYSFAQISAQAIKDAGYVGVMRYLGGSARLTPVERDNLFAVGLGIGLVWETAADEAEHPERGASDALQAEAEADKLGYPTSCPIFYADDHNDPSVAEELGYFQGVRRNARRTVGVYSGGNVVKAVMDGALADYGWMVETWFPNNGAEPHLIQRANSKAPIVAGVAELSYDSNILVRPFPLWRRSNGGGVTTRRKVDKVWCAFVADLNYCDVYYNGVLVDGFKNDDEPNQFNVGRRFQRYIDQGTPWTFYPSENAYSGARARLKAANGSAV